MKALMFGWEFPPHILGGLGTASYGLTKGMSLQQDMEITFVIPKPWGDEDQSFLRIIGANQVPVVWKNVDYQYVMSRVANADNYFHFRNGIRYDFSRIGTNELGCINFSGRYPENLLEEISNYEAVAGVLAHSLEFDVIHSHDWLTYPAGIFAKNISGKPLVIHVHATDYDRSRGQVNPDVYRIEKAGMDNANHIITVSNLTRQTVIERYCQPSGKVTTVHNAVEPLPFVNELQKPERKDKIVTFLGRITMQKGPEYFIEVAACVLAHTSGVRFVMAGSGDMMNKMIRLAAQKGITDRFHFTGFLKGRDVYEMLAQSDVYVMPSVSEPFGISPLEAMQCGTPSIISKQSGCA
ncbi:MAG: glycosyltransferase, partial [Prevotellaceae bacterium]|nr:glycosyltransferase [Prevotellaceae bacterium]